MGCDIHTMAEIKYPHSEQWVAVEVPIFDNGYYRSNEPIGLWNIPYTSEPYQGRNYGLFARLADVRNGEKIEPLADPRGVPDDASDAWLAFVGKWGPDLHSTSYFTLHELVEADWSFDVTWDGVINEDVYLDRKARGYTGSPDAWAGAVWSGNSRTVEAADYDAGQRAEPGEKTFVHITWTEPFNESIGSFLVAIEGLKRAALPKGPPPAWNEDDTREPDFDAVRLVFGFDN